MSRTAQYMQGRREALKWAITFLHAKAEGMNDYSAKAALNVAATDIGNWTRDGSLPHIKKLLHAPSHLDQVAKAFNVGEYRADYSPVRPEELEDGADLRELYDNSRPVDPDHPQS